MPHDFADRIAEISSLKVFISIPVEHIIPIGTADNGSSFFQFKVGLISRGFFKFFYKFSEKGMFLFHVAMLKIGHISVDEIPTCPGKVGLSASLLCSNTDEISAYPSLGKQVTVLVGTRAATNTSRGLVKSFLLRLSKTQ